MINLTEENLLRIGLDRQEFLALRELNYQNPAIKIKKVRKFILTLFDPQTQIDIRLMRYINDKGELKRRRFVEFDISDLSEICHNKIEPVPDGSYKYFADEMERLSFNNLLCYERLFEKYGFKTWVT